MYTFGVEWGSLEGHQSHEIVTNMKGGAKRKSSSGHARRTSQIRPQGRGVGKTTGGWRAANASLCRLAFERRGKQNT